MNSLLAGAKRIVIKVGSALLVDDQGRVSRSWLQSLAFDVAGLRSRGHEVIIVSSGAIAVGQRRLSLAPRTLKLEEKQAAASVGQIALAHAWAEAFSTHDLQTGQLLLTLGDTEDRRRYLNARATVETLLKMGVIPVVNENDTVATSEIRFGDNDRLSARVAVMATAEMLILLSDVDGLYDKNPKLDPAARHVAHVAAIDAKIEAMAGDSVSQVGTGGMRSKIEAAKIAVGAGCPVILTQGDCKHPIERLSTGARHTLFDRSRSIRAARKDWIAGSLATQGILRIDQGAWQALKRGSSLLPAGVVAAEGAFERGDAVEVQTETGTPVARGLTAYDSSSAQAIIGSKSAEIANILGYEGRREIIHRDDLVLL